jgi:uncharacterized membrane protein (DUF485 family)
VRGLRLARIAAQAELLRLRALLRRQATRVAFAVVAGFFLLAALVGAHVAGAMALAEHVTPIQAALIVAGIDLLIAIILAAIAARDTPGAVEREALALRREAVDQAIETAMVASLLRRLLRARSWRDLTDVAATALAAWVVGNRG